MGPEPISTSFASLTDGYVLFLLMFVLFCFVSIFKVQHSGWLQNVGQKSKKEERRRKKKTCRKIRLEIVRLEPYPLFHASVPKGTVRYSTLLAFSFFQRHSEITLSRSFVT